MLVHHHEKRAVNEQVFRGSPFLGFLFDGRQLERIDGQGGDLDFCPRQEEPARGVALESLRVSFEDSRRIEIGIGGQAYQPGATLARQRLLQGFPSGASCPDRGQGSG